MASTNKTAHYELSQYVSSDKPTYLVDYNGDMAKIDTGINAAKTTADGASTAATNAASDAANAQSTANTAVTNAAAAQTSADSANTKIGTLANLNTTEKTNLVGATNEVNTKIGDLANLNTSVKTSVVNAINSIETKIEELDNYTSTESDTGKTWIDGKHIYRKVVDCGTLVNNNTKSVNHLISNFDRLVDMFLICHVSTGYYYTANIYGTTGLFDGKHVAARINSSQIQIGCDGDLTAHEAVAIVEYTKTTD